MAIKAFIAVVLTVMLAPSCVTFGPGAEQRDRIVLVKVKRNDTLNIIAKRHDTTWQEIVTLNRDQLTNGLREGQELRVRLSKPSLTSIEAEDLAADDQEGNDELEFLSKRKRGFFFRPRTSEPPQLVQPAPGRVSSHFGKRGRKLHKGIDIVANVGTPIVASADGEVIFSGRQRGYGSTVVVDHGEFMTLYAHASKLIARAGDRVRQGDFIAKVGRTGNARGAHLHFELRDRDNKPINPIQYFSSANIAGGRTNEAFISRVAALEATGKPKSKKSRNGSKQSHRGKSKKRLLYARD